jgi:hypothetical protein
MHYLLLLSGSLESLTLNLSHSIINLGFIPDLLQESLIVKLCSIAVRYIVSVFAVRSE